jgi:MarR family transcriptional regulator, organic hydroperoxide resistance regulator
MTSPSVGLSLSPTTRQILAPHGIGYRLKLLAQISSRRFQEKLEPFGLTPFHWIVLCCLWQEDGLATSSLGDKLQQVGGTLTGVLDRMAERGLIRRERDIHDRRIWRIWLTPAGRGMQDVLPPLSVAIREQALQGISIPDREQLSLMLDRIIANLDGSVCPGDPARSDQAPSWQAVLAPYSLGYRVKLLVQLGTRKFQEQLEPLGLTPFHWLVLCCLWQQDGLATSSLGDQLQQVGGTLTGVLDRMTERQLIRRERACQDRRVWRIWLTDTGREMSQVLPPIVHQLLEQLMRGLSPTEREQFSQWINRAIENLRQ